MTTLGELINELTKIQNAIDKTEVRGTENRRLLNDAYDRCSLLIDAINESIQEIQNGSNSEEG